jgi:septal ring factor EnvC (AmiA/AmiB activator)
LHIKKEIDQRVNEIAQLKQKQRKLEEIVNEQKEKIDNFEKEVAQKDRELKKLFIALSSVKARKNREFT